MQPASSTAQHAEPRSFAEAAASNSSAAKLEADRSGGSQMASERHSGQATTSGRQFNSKLGIRSQERQAEQSVADKLISVFANKTPTEWRKLIAFSKQWPTLADR